MTLSPTYASSIGRRRFLGYLAGATTTVLLAGCGTAASAGTTTLNVWGGVPLENGPRDLIAAFQQANPSIKVNYTRFVNDDTGNTKLDTALQGGTPIDVYFTYDVPRMGQRIKSGLAEDLTSYIQSDSVLKSWTATTDGLFTYQNTFYSLPTTREPNFIAINKKLLDAAGQRVPQNWTIDEFHTLARTLTRVNGGQATYGSYAPPDLSVLTLGPNAMYTDGGKASNFDNPVFRQSMQLHLDMIKEKSAFPWTDVMAQNLRVYQQGPYLNGQLAMWPSSPYNMRYVRDASKYPHDFVTTFAPIPRPTNASSYYNGGGLNNWIMLSKKAKNKDAAWKFIRYWIGDGSKYMLKGSKNPVLPGISQDEQVNSILGSNKDQLFDAAAFKRVIFDPNIKLVTNTITVAGAQMTKILQAQSDRCLIGEISVDQWATTLKQQCDAAIKQAGS